MYGLRDGDSGFGPAEFQGGSVQDLGKIRTQQQRVIYGAYRGLYRVQGLGLMV